MSGTGDKIKGVGQEFVGKAKEKFGDATNNERLQAEGVADQAKGRLTQAKGDVKDKADDVADRVGDKVDVSYIRDGKPRHVMAVIAETPADAAARDSEDDREAAPDLHRGLIGAQLTDAPNAGGVQVRSVAAGSPAALAGLRANDVIVKANRTLVGNLRNLREAARGATSLVLTVRRGNTALLIPLR